MSRSTLLALALGLACLGGPVNTPVRTDLGLVKGAVTDGVAAFKGIPYAAPSVGPLRWKPTQPAAPWQGVRDAARFGPVCPQTPYPEGSLYFSPPVEQSEDCLSLNIWTAASGPTEHRPVMVWIHGGALTRGTGSTPTYDGASLARKGVVVVTINYRLGVLGFLAHPDLSAESPHKTSGNYALLDQIEALRWVKRNIAAFGGDPGRVTIFGESAGSWSVNCLVASPLAKGLFHRAIGESGASFGSMTRLEAAEKSGIGFATSLGVDALAGLRELPVDRLLTQQDRAINNPNVDGWVLPDEIRAIFAAGRQNDVPLLIGSNANEMSSLTAPNAVPHTVDAYHRQLSFFLGSHIDEVDALYPAKTDEQATLAYLHALRDITFTLPMRTWARAASSGSSKAWLYFFTHVPPNSRSSYLGAYHAAEIVYAFDNLDLRPQTRWEQSDRDLASTMSAYWVNFATHGDPNGKGLKIWKPYDRETEPYLDLGDPPRLKQHLLKDQLDFIERLSLSRRR